MLADSNEKTSGNDILYIIWSIIYWMNFSFTWYFQYFKISELLYKFKF